jgi:ankyrin repeat protein
VWSRVFEHRKTTVEGDDLDINAQDEYGRTSLIRACIGSDSKNEESGRETVVQYLLARENIDIGIKDHRRKTAIDWARHYNRDRIVSMLQAKIDSKETIGPAS